MFTGSYFTANYFAPRYFPEIGAVTTAIVGGHFLPSAPNKKRTLSNVNVIYEKAQSLPRKETKELRDAISEFVAPEIARQPFVPDMEKINYEALQSNAIAYEKFAKALTNIQERIELMEQSRLKLEQEDDDLMTVAIIASLIH